MPIHILKTVKLFLLFTCVVLNVFEYTCDEENAKVDPVERGGYFWLQRNLIVNIKDRVAKMLPFALGSNKSEGLDTEPTYVGSMIDEFKSHVHAIYPGTHWCGDGDTAKSFEDLGRFQKTDKCCRGHDNCPDFIPVGDTKYGLHNTGLFTRSHCDCDLEFRTCLKDAHTIIASQIGFTYFSVLGPQCFKKTLLKKGCKRYTKGKCIEYSFYSNDTTEYYQWFDSEPFY